MLNTLFNTKALIVIIVLLTAIAGDIAWQRHEQEAVKATREQVEQQNKDALNQFAKQQREAANSGHNWADGLKRR